MQGKSLQAVWVNPGEALPLLDAIGTRGVYLMVVCRDDEEMESVAETVRSVNKINVYGNR